VTGAAAFSIVMPRRPGDAAPADVGEAERVDVEAATLAEALDAGLARARGDVIVVLRPGETLLPGALESAASAMRATGSRAVLGGALLRVPGFESVRVENPAEYRGRFEHLAVWWRGFDTVPRASLFWHRSLIASLGRFAGADEITLDYELVCRIGRASPIRAIDADCSEAMLSRPLRGEGDMLDALIAASRRHWGHGPVAWRCALSLAWWRLQPHERARHHARLAEDAAARGHALRAFVERRLATAWSPAMGRGRFGRIPTR
jgi:hypothetical protein